MQSPLAGLDRLLETERMWLVPLRRELVERRLEDDEFAVSLELTPSPKLVQFSDQWPGDALAMFGLWADALAPGAWTGHWTCVGRGTREAIGMIGLMTDHGGEVEVGYGFIEAAQGIGLATEALVAVVDALHGHDAVRAIVATAATRNPASGRVLEKAGFTKVGQRDGGEDGILDIWEHRAR